MSISLPTDEQIQAAFPYDEFAAEDVMFELIRNEMVLISATSRGKFSEEDALRRAYREVMDDEFDREEEF